MRIKGYLGRMPQPRSFADGAQILRRLFDAQFPRFTADDWLAAARLTWRLQGAAAPLSDPQPAPMRAAAPAKATWSEKSQIGSADDRAAATLVLNYDPKLAHTLDGLDFEHPLPTMWEQFDALAAVPLMVIRGGLSDLLSPATLRAMRARRHKTEVVEVADEGHPPQLGTPDLIRRIAGFARACDEGFRRR